jgi:hypothetical protein
MNASLSTLIRAASLASLALLATTTTPLRGEDNDGDSKPGFFHRLGNAIFKGTRKIEKSDAPGAPDSSPENMAPIKPAPAKPAPAPKKPVKRLDDSSPYVTDGSVVVKDKDYPSSATDPKRVPTKAATDDAQATKSSANATSATATNPSKGAPAANPQSTDIKDYPTATRAKKPGFVKSPYPPYQELDTTGMISGSLARDPTTGKIFRVP